MNSSELINNARRVLSPMKLGEDGSAGDVAAALLGEDGNLYLGVCIDVGSGMGFCAEHSAIASMVTAGETRISKIVAVWGEDTILAPCGRCREFMNQIDLGNLDSTIVVLGPENEVKLRELLPHPYQEAWN